MKKIIALLLALLLMMSAAACSAKTAAAPETTSSAKTTASSSTAAASSSAGTSAAGTTFEPMTIKLGHVLESTHHNQKACEYFADLVSKKTNGAVTVEIYPASQLGSEADETSAMIMGTQEMGLFGIGEDAKLDERLSLPDSAYVFKNRDHLCAYLKSDLFYDLANDSAPKTGIRPLAGTYYGTRELSCNKAVNTLADMKGLKIRCPDQEVFLRVVQALGANPSPMSLSEVYLALSQGVIDGQENPFATILSMKFYEVQKYVTMTNHIVNADFFMCSEKWYEGLSPELQTIITESAREAADYINAISYQEEDAGRKQLEDLGMTIIDLSDEEMAKFVAAGSPTDDMIQAWGGSDYYAQIQALANS